MAVKVVEGKREIGLGLCILILVGSGVLSHYAFRLLGARRSIDIHGFSLDLVAAVAAVVGLAAIHLLAKPVER